MRKAGNQEGRRFQEAITRLASIVIFAARSEASVYLGGRSYDWPCKKYCVNVENRISLPILLTLRRFSHGCEFTTKAEQLATEIATQAKTLDDLNGLMKLMMKSALERMLDTELDVHLGRKRLPGRRWSPSRSRGELRCQGVYKESEQNRRNGHSPKTVQGDLGELTSRRLAIVTARLSRK